MEVSRNFTAGVMNKDYDERVIPNGQYVDALNIIPGSSKDSDVGSVQNIMGNTKIGNTAAVLGFPSGLTNAKTIGAIDAEDIDCIYWLLSSDECDAILELNTINGVVSRILQSNRIGGVTQLGFDLTYIVTGINIINGLLFFTDGLNPPRRINISRARTYAVNDPRIDIDINVILRPPLMAPYLVMGNDGTQSNNMSDKFLYFAYRFKYIDNEYSSLSPFSPAAFAPGNYNVDPQVGYNVSMQNKYNYVDVSFETGNQFVTEVQLIMLDSRSKNIFIVGSFNKQELNIANETSYTFNKFSNNKTYSTLPSDQIGRLFDNVPLTAKAQDIVGSRLMFGNYTEFYDVTDAKFKLEVVSNVDGALPTVNNPLNTLRSNRDYEVGVVYTDEYGRMSTVMDAPNNTIYIPPTNSATANGIKVTIKSPAPVWATNWRLVIKQSKDNYYNLFPILFYKDGNYRYFLINESDRDKVSVGDYITFKADANGITNNNKQYKVLEIALKEADFISSTTTSEYAGLYLKIKVDNANDFDPNALYNYLYVGDGVSTTIGAPVTGLLGLGLNAPVGEIPPPPLTNPINCADNPIFYGNGNGSVLTVANNNQYLLNTDLRYTIEIDSPTTFRYTTNINGTGPFTQQNVTIVPNTNIPILNPSGTSTAFNIIFSTSTGFIVGDKWKISCRGPVYVGSSSVPSTNYFGGIGIAQMTTLSYDSVGGYAIIPGVLWSPNNAIETDRTINVGAVITLQIVEDRYNSGAYIQQQIFPPSDRTYANIEEWFVESGAYQIFIQHDLNGNNVGANRVSFRRGAVYQMANGSNNGSDQSNTVNQGGVANATTMAYPVRMFIAGYGKSENINNQNHIRVAFKIQQQDAPTIMETVPKQNDLEIFHELTRTYKTSGGNHRVKWDYEDYTFFTSSSPILNGKTALKQLTPSYPHDFEVGETVYVTTSVPALNGALTVIGVPDMYTIVVDVPFPGSGPVTPGEVAHNSIDTNQLNTTTNPAVVIINNPKNKNSNYNAYTWGNGQESNRIKDDFNQSTLEYSPRATSVIEDYEERHNKEALTYSGVYRETTSINRLNEFNLSVANFKYLDKSFGSIQLIYARDTDLLTFQENKVSSVLFGKNLISDSVGGGSIVSVPEVLGTQIAYPYEYGISNNPESFSTWGDDIFFTDAYRGVVLQLNGNQITEASALGMEFYFKNLFISNLNTQKIGMYDPYNKVYVLSMNDESVLPCKIKIDPNARTITRLAATNLNLFYLSATLGWALQLVDLGFGTSWLTLNQTSGFGDRQIRGTVAANTTGASRQIGINVIACGTTYSFTLTQTNGKVIDILNVIYNNVGDDAIIRKL
jgi:hypothetical protein